MQIQTNVERHKSIFEVICWSSIFIHGVCIWCEIMQHIHKKIKESTPIVGVLCLTNDFHPQIGGILFFGCHGKKKKIEIYIPQTIIIVHFNLTCILSVY